MYTRDRNSYVDKKKRKQHSSPVDDGSTVEVVCGRVGRSKVRHDEQTPHQMVDFISS